MKFKEPHAPRRVALAAGLCCGLATLAGHAGAAETASWEYVIVATSEQESLTPPMLSVAPNGALQVGFANFRRVNADPATAPWPRVVTGGVYLQELGGKRRLLAADNDPTPGQASRRLCFNFINGLCPPGTARLSVDQGKVAFMASSTFEGQAAMSGIYLADGVTAPRRVVDQGHADGDGGNAQRLRQQHGLNRIRQMIIQTWLNGADMLAEPQHDAEFFGLHAEET